MPRKTKENPSGKPVLTKSSKAKGYFIKSLQNNTKKLNRFLLHKDK
jgi:hypothetical protein